jgi:hypothetical protein
MRKNRVSKIVSMHAHAVTTGPSMKLSPGFWAFARLCGLYPVLIGIAAWDFLRADHVVRLSAAGPDGKVFLRLRFATGCSRSSTVLDGERRVCQAAFSVGPCPAATIAVPQPPC